MEYLKQDLYGEERQLFLVKSSYDADGSLAVLCFEHVEQDNEIMDKEWFFVTVNLAFANVPNPETDAFIDTNHSPRLEEILKRNGIAEPIGFYCNCGCCSYPLYRFNLNKLHSFNEINR